MVRIDAPDRSSASSIAAAMARPLATISAASARALAPISASAISLAEAVRFSICELAADSERRSTA